MTTKNSSPLIMLVAGHWLGAWAWDDVLENLTNDQVRAIAITLPGFESDDPDRATRTLDDQVSAIKNVFSQHEVSEECPAIIVAHSGANAPVSILLDRYPEFVQRVVWVDSGPVATGSVFAPGLPAEVQELPLPEFDALGQQTSSEGLSAEVLERFRSRAVPVPAPVLRQPVTLTNDARHDVKTTLVCCSIPVVHMLELARTGHPMFSEVAHLNNLEVIDLPTGHWPMWSRPRDLANMIQCAAYQSH